MALEKIKEKLISKSESLDETVLSVGPTAVLIDDNVPTVDVKLSPIGLQAPDRRGAYAAADSSIRSANKLERMRVIPYATAHLQNYYMNSLLDLIEAKKLERQLEEAIVARLYSLATGPTGDATQVLSMIDRVDQEIEVAEKIISAVESLLITYEEIDSAFNKEKQVENVTTLMLENIKFFGIEPLVAEETNEASDYQQLVAKITALSDASLHQSSATQLYLQCLYDADFALRMGVSAAFFVPDNFRSMLDTIAAPDGGIVQTGGRTVVDPWTLGVQRQFPGIKELDAQGFKGFERWDGFRGESGGQDPFKRMSDLAGMDPIQKVAYYSTALSREFLLSAGLARLEGTPIGQKFGGTTEDPFQRLFGARGITEAWTAKVPAGSLAAFAIVKEGGSLDVTRGPGKKVYLLESVKQQSPEEKKAGCTTAKKIWIDSVKRDPFHNEMGVFDDVLQSATDSFAQGQQYLETLLCRDQERDLLTPRGLFTRIIKDFATLMQGLTMDTEEAPTENAAKEFAILSAIGRVSAPSTRMHDAREASAFARRMILMYLAQETVQRRVGVPWGTAGTEEGDAFAEAQATAAEALAGRMRIVSNPTRWARIQNWEEIETYLAVCIEMLASAWNDGEPPLGFGVEDRRDGEWNGRSILGTITDLEVDQHVNIESTIIKIWEDLQDEAQKLAESDSQKASYLRENGTTLNAAFDASTCFAMILNCFIELTTTFVRVRLQADRSPITSFKAGGKKKISYEEHVERYGEEGAHDAKNTDRTAGHNAKVDRQNEIDRAEFNARQTEQTERVQARTGIVDDAHERFLQNVHKVYYLGGNGPGDATNVARKYLAELAAASEANDLSALIDADGLVTVVDTQLPARTNIAVGHGHATPISLIEAMEELAQEDDAVTDLFSVPQALVENLVSKSANLSEKAAALRTTSDVADTEELEILRGLRSAAVTTNFLKAMSSTQVSLAKKRLAAIKDAPAETHLVDHPAPTVFEAYKALLEEKRGEFVNGAVFFLGLPQHSVNEAISEELVDKNHAILEVSLDKVDQTLPGVEFQEIIRHFVLECSTTKELIKEAYAQSPPPTTFSELVTTLKFHYQNHAEPLTGEDIIFKSNNPSSAREALANELESFLLKSMYQDLTGFAFSEEMIQQQPLNQRNAFAAGLTQTLIRPFGLDDGTVDQFFERQGDSISFPNMIRVNKLIQPQPTIVSGTNAYNVPTMSTTQAETIYSLFSTKPFFVESVTNAVVSPSVFDKVVAVFIDLDSFEIDSKLTVQNFIRMYIDRGETDGGAARIAARKKWHELPLSANRVSMPSVYASLKIKGE